MATNALETSKGIASISSSVPIAWEEISEGLKADQFTVDNIRHRRTCALGQRADRFPIKWTHLIGRESPKSRPLRLDSGEPGVLQSQLFSTCPSSAHRTIGFMRRSFGVAGDDFGLCLV
jgi:hypothetical protein